MTTVTLGSTGITVDKNGFGALPIQRITKEEAAHLLRKAYEGGITFFDTARAYTDSEEKIGYALSDIRSHIYIATKTMSTTVDGFWKDLETSLIGASLPQKLRILFFVYKFSVHQHIYIAQQRILPNVLPAVAGIHPDGLIRKFLFNLGHQLSDVHSVYRMQRISA